MRAVAERNRGPGRRPAGRLSTLCAVPGTRLAAVVAALALASPAAAFGQGAGDDQYQDPFPEERAQVEPGDGLTDEPPVPDAPDDPGGSGGGDGADPGAGGTGGGTDPAPGTEGDSAATPPGQLPNTGSEPLWLAYAGLTFLLIGAGLRLRTIDPDAY
jgi:LPXTG-motif cell wall-anchored protein